MTVRGSPQRHRWAGDVPGQPRLLRRLISTVVAVALRQDQVKIKQGCCAPREPRDASREDCTMNAIATIAPAGPQYMRALERANESV
jgi:hypothetical protein